MMPFFSKGPIKAAAAGGADNFDLFCSTRHTFNTGWDYLG